MTLGYSPAMLEHVLDEALVWAIRDGRNELTWRDIQRARLSEEIGIGQPVARRSCGRPRPALETGQGPDPPSHLEEAPGDGRALKAGGAHHCDRLAGVLGHPNRACAFRQSADRARCGPRTSGAAWRWP